VSKTESFDRWARDVIADEALWRAAKEIDAGQFEADLGQGVCIDALDSLAAAGELKEIRGAREENR
jgi:hypothetical protein